MFPREGLCYAVRSDMVAQTDKPADPVTVVIIALNESRNIEAAVRSARRLGPVLVIDGGSKDDTVPKARASGAETVVNPSAGFAAQRRFAIAQVGTEWMLFLDADEEVTEPLAEEIRALRREGDGYLIPRRSRFLGRWMKHGSWGRDRVLRLFRTSAATVAERRVHEEVTVPGGVGILENAMLHYAQDDFETVGRKFTAYVPLMAAEIAEKRGRVSLSDIALRPVVSFLRDYLLRRGFLDSWQGFVLAAWGAASVLAKYSEARRVLETGGTGPGCQPRGNG